MIAIRFSMVALLQLATLTLVATPGGHAEGPYHFQCLASDEGPFDGFLKRAPSINDAGVVAFFATHDTGIQAVYTHDGTRPTLVADSSGRLSTFGPGFPVINDAGEVAFRARLDSGESGLFLGSDQLRTLVSTDGPFESLGSTSIYSSPSLSNDGVAAFYATRHGEDAAIYRVESAGEPTEIAGKASGFHVIGDAPWIDREHIVTFFARNVRDELGIFRIDPEGRAVEVLTSRRIDGLTDTFSCNNAGAVAFRVVRDNGSVELRVVEADRMRCIADTQGVFRDFGNLTMNDRGDVVFTALHDDGPFGIYDGPNPSSDAVIRHGDLLEGQSVRYLALSRRGMNDSGWIAFYAGFDDGGGGIFVARPRIGLEQRSDWPN